jgi:tetratricopeptide (TPR) repeat protein
MSRTLPLRRLQGLAAFAVGAAVTLALASPAAALNQARIHGTITDENKKPLEGVDVLVTCPDVATIRLETKTDAKGNWAITLVDATKLHHYKFSKEGYQIMEQDLKIPINSNERRNFTMASLASLGATAPAGQEPTANDKAILIFNQGAEASQMGDTITAKKKMQEAIATDPSLLPAHSALAVMYLADKQYAEAAAEAELVLGQEPKNERAVRVAVDAYKQLGNKEKYALHAATLAAMDPTAGAIDTYNQGVQAYNAGDMAKARGFFEQSATANPGFAKVFYMLGMCYVSEGNNAKAREAMDTFIAKADSDDPDLATAKEMLAYLK